MFFYRESKAEENAAQDFDEKDADNVSFGRRSRAQSARKRRDSYDYVDTVQLLGMYLYPDFVHVLKCLKVPGIHHCFFNALKSLKINIFLVNVL